MTIHIYVCLCVFTSLSYKFLEYISILVVLHEILLED